MEQTHQNLELVAVIDVGAPADVNNVLEALSEIPAERLRVKLMEEKRTLSALRNISRELATGGVLCQWDDDDIFAPERVAQQLEALVASGKSACYLQQCYHLFESVDELYITDWGRSPNKLRAHPGTLMSTAPSPHRYPENGDTANLGEDTYMFREYDMRGDAVMLKNQPEIFVYVYHGRNSWNLEHHRSLAQRYSFEVAETAKRAETAARVLAETGVTHRPVRLMSNVSQVTVL